MFAGIDTNEGDNAFLDIYLEGEAKAWVAVGFTDSPSMVKGPRTHTRIHICTYEAAAYM